MLRKTVVLGSLGCLFACEEPAPSQPLAPVEPTRILVFYKTSGFYHASIPAGLAAIQRAAPALNLAVDTTNNAARFTPAGLQPYAAVVFLSTTQDVLTPQQQTAFESYIRSGRGFVGIHAATDTKYDWPWYNGLVGGYFNGHPAVQPATVRVTDKAHPATAGLPDAWVRTDEWYNFRSLHPGLKVLANLDETTYAGGTMGAAHPIAWYHAYDGGRAFYTAGGHTAESFAEPLFMQHVMGGITYAVGK